MSGTIGFVARPSHAQASSASTGVVIPLYNYPDSTWTTIEQTAAAHPSVPIIAVINPNSGPGSSGDPTYAQGVSGLQSAGVKVLGYVATGYATSSYSALSNIESQVSDYSSWYHVNGIFFDEMSNTPGYESYYSTLNSFVKSIGMTYTMGNPGTSVPSSYIGTLNNLVIYENAGYPSMSFISYPGYPNSDFGYIAYGVSYDSSFVASSAPDVGYMYIDDQSGGNPYATLSSYFTETVGTLSTVDGTGTSTTTTSSSHSTSTTSSSRSTSTASSTSSTTTTTTKTTSSTTSSSGTVTIKVKSVNSAGTTFTGMWTTISSSSGTLLASGYTTFSYSARSHSTYVVCVSNYKSTVFEHWSNGSTNPCLTVTPTSNVLLTAYYGTSASSRLVVSSQTTTGAALTGFWTVLYDQTGTVLATGYTPTSYTLSNGQSYTIEADSYGSCNFAYWQDNGDTNYQRTVSITSNTDLVAVYAC